MHVIFKIIRSFILNGITVVLTSPVKVDCCLCSFPTLKIGHCPNTYDESEPSIKWIINNSLEVLMFYCFVNWFTTHYETQYGWNEQPSHVMDVKNDLIGIFFSVIIFDHIDRLEIFIVITGKHAEHQFVLIFVVGFIDIGNYITVMQRIVALNDSSS